MPNYRNYPIKKNLTLTNLTNHSYLIFTNVEEKDWLFALLFSGSTNLIQSIVKICLENEKNKI